MKVSEQKEVFKRHYEAALKGGIENRGYSTTANGYVDRFIGKCLVTVDGVSYEAIGIPSDGDAWSIYRASYIKFVEVQS